MKVILVLGACLLVTACGSAPDDGLIQARFEQEMADTWVHAGIHHERVTGIDSKAALFGEAEVTVTFVGTCRDLAKAKTCPSQFTLDMALHDEGGKWKVVHSDLYPMP